MGVYIKGMEMPTGNHEIIMRIQSDGCVLDQWGHRFNQEFTAVPVPPHGRLGDLDALMRHCVMLPMDGGRLLVVYASYVSNAPTIIPAEEEER